MKGWISNPMNNTNSKHWVLITCAALLLTVLMTLSLISCGRNSEHDDTGTNHAEGAGPRPGDAGDANPAGLLDLASAFDRDLFYGETLTISVSTDSSHMQALADAYMQHNPGVIVEVIPNYIAYIYDEIFDGTYTYVHRNYALSLETANEVRWYVNNRLENGTAPILICSRIIDHHNPRSVRYLADWFPIMSASPYFDEDEYFFNVFHAVAIDGRLYTFPTRFSYRMVVANSTVPGLVPLLGTHNDMYGGVTISQQMEMMRHLWSAGNQMYLDSYFDVFVGIWDYLYNFINMDIRHVDFNNQRFIDFITNALEITCPNTIYGQRRVSNRTTHARDVELRERYFFQHIGDTVFQYFVDFGEDFHGNYFAFMAPTPIIYSHDEIFDFSSVLTIADRDAQPQHNIVAPAPIVSSRGELIITTYDSFVLNAHATAVQQALALDFMEFITSFASHTAITRLIQPPIQLMPINRDLFARIVGFAILDATSNIALASWTNYHGPVWAAQLNDIGIHLYTTIGEMPMITTQMPPEVTSIIFEELEAFHIGSVPAEETARNLQNRVSAALH